MTTRPAFELSRTLLVPAGYAEFEPVRENSTELGRQENRRIEIIMLPQLIELAASELPDGGSPSAARDAGAIDASAAPDGGARDSGP